MANYDQIKAFYPKDMGKQKGWCLQNCRVGFHIYTPKYPSAKAAMDAAKKNGTYHAGTPPTNIAVPVYVTSPSKYGHVVVCDHGTWYTDGKRYTPAKGSIYGWDEMMDGTRVVKVSSSSSFLPAKGYWARYDKDERVAKLSTFMYKTFPSYTNKKALGNIYGDYLWKSIKEFQKRTGLYPDGMTGKITYAKLQQYGFKG
jgi:hypothetical protein